jgi:SAM-dependent methyltransferase
MKALPPGNILQNIYLRKRLKGLESKRFLEVGSGNGLLSNVILKSGLKGIGCDLNFKACENNKILNSDYINNGFYEVINIDFMELKESERFDVIVSAFVIEHIEFVELEAFIGKMKRLLSDNGKLILFVPSSMKYWGIEDEMAGHIKRYEFEDFENFFGLKKEHILGLTYPISNLLFGMSNFLVKRNESAKLKLSQKERTVYTGNRNVPFKTTFPSVFKLLLNEVVLYPFHILQVLFGKNKNSMVIYCELKNRL